MLGYIFSIALLNLGLGFALAVYLGRNRPSLALEDPASTSRSSAEEAAAGEAPSETPLVSDGAPVQAEGESISPEADDAVAEPAVAAANVS